MDFERVILLMQRLNCLSKAPFLKFIQERELDLTTSIFAWLFEKAIDLVEGVIQLHKSDMDECAQILIRTLYETYLKYKHYAQLINSNSLEEASLFVFQSIYLMREKDILEFDKLLPHRDLIKQFVDLKEFKEKYSSRLKKIKNFGFLEESIEAASRRYHMKAEYQYMYRNFSKSVHSFDLIEYIKKQQERKNISDGNYIELQKMQVFCFVFEVFIEMMTKMNIIFDLGIVKELNQIKIEYTSGRHDK